MLEKLSNHNEWLKYYNDLCDRGHIDRKEKEDLKKFIDNKEYLSIANDIYNYNFSYPLKKEISKMGKSKKRIVYIYPREENYIFKFISSKLYKYEYLFTNNLYSYRKNLLVKDAIKKISRFDNKNNMYIYKVDISNYFNSIDIDILISILEKYITDDIELLSFLKRVLLNNKVIYKDSIIEEKKGAMGGVPISAFLANIYLKEVDDYYAQNNVDYFRYADDIIIFAHSSTELESYTHTLKEFIKKYKLTINSDKENYYYPNDKFEFLGFSFNRDIVDLSDSSIKKIKGRIKRSARGFRRWMIKHNADSEYILKAMNRKFNNKFYKVKDSNDLNWSLWYFPLINTTKSLNIIDKYMQENLRYIVCGKYNKRNFRKVPYEVLKKYNYKPLVHEYYEYNKYKLVPLKDCININLYNMYQDIPSLDNGEVNILNGKPFDEFKSICKSYLSEDTNRYILVYRGDYIGELGIRTTLNDFWINKGSQIFYKIRSTKRRKGYGYKILELGLKECKKLGFNQVRVNCSDTNIGSKKIIIYNGGIEDIVSYKTKTGTSTSYIIKL
jgi:hypothetical protein